MKKIIPFLLSLVSQLALSETVVFDFTEPLNLNYTPELSQSDLYNYHDYDNPNYDGSLVSGVAFQLQRYTLTEKDVSLKFSKPKGSSGAGIYRYGNLCSLSLGVMASMHFSVNDECTLDTIILDRHSSITLPPDESGNPQGGSWNYLTNTWVSNNVEITELTLRNGDQVSDIYHITVKYSRKAPSLMLNSTSPSEGSVVNSPFSKLLLTFNKPIKRIEENNAILLAGISTGNSSNAQTMNATISPDDKNVVILSTPAPLNTVGEYAVTIPARTVFDEDNFTINSAIRIQFKVENNRSTFNYAAVEPKPGKVGELPKEIRLYFENNVKIGTGYVDFVRADGYSFPADTVFVDPGNSKGVVIRRGDYCNPVEEATWTVNIPEKLFHTLYYGVDETRDYWNKKSSIVYVVDGSNAHPQVSDTLRIARELLQLKGVGYPCDTTSTYRALAALVESSETPSNDDIANAMTDLYNETKVTLPVIGKWYKIGGLNSNGAKIYLTFNDDATKVGIGVSANEAASFKVSSVKGDTVIFETREGKYLHIPTVLPLHTGTTDANLTDTISKVNHLKLSKFLASSVEGVSPKDLYGVFTIYGSLGTINGKEEFAYAMLDYNDIRISTYPGWPLEFNDSLSNAFVIEEAAEPADVNTIIPSVGLRPDAIEKPGDEMYLVISGPKKSTINNPNQICFKKDGKKVDFYDTILTPTTTENLFAVNTEDLAQGYYTIEMPLGTFNFEAVNGKKVQDVALSAEFYIRSSGTVVTDGIIPVATLSPTSIMVSGERLVLTIDSVSRALLNDAAVTYFIYADGDKAGERAMDVKLSAIRGTTNQFYVDTKDLKGGKYTLVIPKRTFTYTAKEDGKTVIDVPFILDFSIEGFQGTYNSYIVLMPARINNDSYYMRSVDMNQMILYIYDNMVVDHEGNTKGLVPNPDVKVWIMYSQFGIPVLSGHFEEYPTFAEDYGSDYENTHAIMFVPDHEIQPGEFENFAGMYGFYCETGAFGDANYGKYLAGDKGIRPEDCSINLAGSLASFEINNIMCDVNGDKKVDVADIASVISVMAGEKECIYADVYADVNYDGTVDVADIATIISRMAELSRPQQIEFEDE